MQRVGAQWPAIGLVASIVLAASVSMAAPKLPSASTPQQVPGADKVDVDFLLEHLSLEEKVGQLIIVGFSGTHVNRDIEKWVRDRKVGGVALFSRNIVNFPQTARFTRDIHALSKNNIPLFLALDQEGGNVVRVKEGAILLPGNMAMGATRDPTLAYVAGQALAIDLRRLGFNMNLAPVLDVNSNPRNPVIGVRSYGEDPELVGSLGAWYVRGQQELGLVAVAKHFPGHGDTQSDSHFSMPSINVNMERLDQIELRPFKRAIDAGLDAVMTAHIALPQVAEARALPATLSKVVLTDLLRKRLGFNGIVMTDGLEMQGIVDRYGSGRAAVLAVLAGADMTMVLWAPRLKEDVYNALLQAVRKGEISERRLNQSVRRILLAKARRGMFNQRPEPLQALLAQKTTNDIHDRVAERIARESVTLVRNHGDILPLRASRYRKVVVVSPPGPLASRLAKEPFVTVQTLPSTATAERRARDVQQTLALAKNADLVVMAVVTRNHVDSAREVMKALRHVPMAVVSLASPYYLSNLEDIDAYVCAYGYLDVSQLAVADALLGLAPMTGRLPISIPGYYPYGHRVETGLAQVRAAGHAAASSIR